MAEDPKVVEVATTIQDQLADVSHAPFVFFDAVPSHGQFSGIANLTLSAMRLIPDGNGAVRTAPVVVAYLRTNLLGAIALRDAADKTIAMISAQTTQGAKPN